jgi:hypothetical protein
MTSRATARPFPIAAVLAGVLGSLMILLLAAGGGSVGVQPPPASPTSPAAKDVESTAVTTTVYLPLVGRQFPSLTVFGMELAALSDVGGLAQAAAAGSSWVRWSGAWWPDLEPSKGSISESALIALDTQLAAAARNNLQVILVVHGTPAWAQAKPPSLCGPIKGEELGAFAGLLRTLVARYSVGPYSVKYWEIWNEPDAGYAAAGSVFGCWGDPADAYYGGGAYANLLQAAYPAIKSIDPSAQVLVGGLLLDCDPANTSICKDGKEKPALFLEGILHHNGQNDGGQYFDGVSFHTYDYYTGSPGQYFNPNWQTANGTTGPVGIAKAHFVEGVLSAHGVTGKYLINTESAILCDSCAGDAAFEATKAYYLAQSYGSAIAEGWRANIWYSVLGWRNSGLLNPDLSPRPAFDAFRAARAELRDARLLGEIAGYPGVKGYAFNRGDRQVWLLWSLDGADHAVTLPFIPSAVFDVFGSSLGVSSTMTVTLAPVYVEP